MSFSGSVRAATLDDRLAVARLVDGAMLAVPDLAARIDAGDVLLAVRPGGHPLGTLVSQPTEEGREIRAIAVERSVRDRGIGRALVEAVRGEGETLVAEFDASVRPFYASLGFSVQPVAGAEDRYRGVLAARPPD